jgi:hypothetical protein
VILVEPRGVRTMIRNRRRSSLAIISRRRTVLALDLARDARA